MSINAQALHFELRRIQKMLIDKEYERVDRAIDSLVDNIIENK